MSAVLASSMTLLLAAAPALAPAEPVAALPLLPRPPVLEEFLGAAPQGMAALMARVDDFRQSEPSEGQPASGRTAAYLGRDAGHLYVVFVVSDPEPAAIRARFTRRDGIFEDDRVGVWLDTFADQRHALGFLVNPRNVQGDFAYTDPDVYDVSFDALWDSRTVLTPDGYAAWLSIPFRSLRFPPGAEQRWRVLLERTVARRPEYGYWPALSSSVGGRTRQFGRLEAFAEAAGGASAQVAPFASFRSARGPGAAGSAADVGFDAKAVLRGNVVVDATVNPDFSQVESDEPQVLANQRFEVLFPEKRPFFLENAPMFRTLTDGERVQLFFTRRIVEPGAGGRLTGQLGPWTVAGLGADDRHGEARATDAVAVVRRSLPARADVGLFASVRDAGPTRNAVAAAEARLTLGPSWWAAALLAASRTRDDARPDAGGTAFQAELHRDGAHLSARTRLAAIGPGFRDDLGFVPRTDVRVGDQTLRWLWRPGAAVVFHGPHLTLERVLDHAGRGLDATAAFGYEARLAGANDLFLERREQGETFRGVHLRAGTTTVRWTSATLPRLSGTGALTLGTAVNHDPAAGTPPAVGRTWEATLGLTVRPADALKLDQTLLLTRLDAPGGGARVLEDRVWRSTLSAQLTHALSLRVILDHRRLRTDPRRSALVPDRRSTADLLLAYEIRPATALYVGYGRAAAGDATDAPARQLFVKASYLFRR